MVESTKPESAQHMVNQGIHMIMIQSQNIKP